MHTREEELTKGTNFIAVFLEDTASDPRLQSAAISMKVSPSHSKKMTAYQRTRDH